MIISTWLVYIVVQKSVGAPFPSAGAPGILAADVGTVSLMEQWLHEVEDRTSRFFRQTPAGAVAQRAESTSAPPVCQAESAPNLQVAIRGLSVAVPHSSVWELGEDNMGLIAHPLGRSLSHSFLEDRTTIQLLRQSQTQVCCVLGMPGDEAAREGLEQIQNCMSQLMLQDKPDTMPGTEPDTDAQVLLSSKD